ncbi:ShlB/FhaC/HecB family hemolysin secretion/activation protein, partial [Oceanivirga salmonicida]|uniref:ShlB/FhaC/HecB family hemolysin secretion/activation protein n=4 Tax=Oceanivirga salmonicida TaxID=1769291 RepID=UPI0018CC248E
MKKIIYLLLPISLYASKVDKVFYNNKETVIPLYLSSGIRKGQEYTIEQIDTLIENFNYAKGNDINVSIEPSSKEGYSNIIMTNKKKNPFYVSFSYNNHGNDFDTGIYKYTVNAGLEGVLLNEKLDISYTF